MVGDTWIKIQAEQRVRDILHQELIRLASAKERAREKAAAIAFRLLVLSKRAVNVCLMNRSL